jgi:hypothetical protein
MPFKWLVVCCGYLWMILDFDRILDLGNNQFSAGSIPDSVLTLTGLR